MNKPETPTSDVWFRWRYCATFGQACHEPGVQSRGVVYPGTERFPLRHGAQAIGLGDMVNLLKNEAS